MKALLGMVMPGWLEPLLIGLAVMMLVTTVGMKIHQHDVKIITDYQAKEAVAAGKVFAVRVKVLHDIEVRYLPAKQKIITQIETITKEIPVYVTAADNAACTVNAGFVRAHDAAWSGADPPTPGESDREPAGVSLAQVDEVSVANAGACRLWREQALRLREAYELVRQAK